MDAIKTWIESGRVEVSSDASAGFGIIENGQQPKVDDDYPFWLITNAAGDACYFAYWEPAAACPNGSCRPGKFVPICCSAKGEYKTVLRVADTVAEDRKQHGLTDEDGWLLADSTTIFGPDLSKATTVKATTTITAVIETGGTPQPITVNLDVEVPSPYFARDTAAGEFTRYSLIRVAGCL